MYTQLLATMLSRIRRWIKWSNQNDRIFNIGGEITNKLKMSISICCYISMHTRRIEKLTTRCGPRHVNWWIPMQKPTDAIVCSNFLTNITAFLCRPSAFRASLLVSCAPGNILCAVTPRAIITRVLCFDRIPYALHYPRSSLGGCAPYVTDTRIHGAILI